MKKLKILYSSNAIWASSGYAINSLQLVPQIKDDGYDIAMINFYGQEGGIFNINGIKMYPKMNDAWGSDAMINHAKDFKADCVITNQDIWVLDPNILKQLPRWIPYLPVDHDPIPPAVLNRARLAYRIIAYSKFAEKELKRNSLHSTYIPLTVETEIFKPLANKKQYRKLLGLPEDYFIFGMVSANKDNPPRKSFQEAIDAFKLFHDNHPKSALYIHTIPSQQGGFPIPEYSKFIGLEKFIYYPEDIYALLYKVDREQLAKIYNTFDVLLAPSLNEGFGVPIIEAQSCGIPVIVNNCTSMPELIIPKKTGLICDVAYKRFDFSLSYCFVPDYHSIHNCMEDLYKKDRNTMGKQAREWVINNYDYKLVYKKYWSPFLKRIENEVYQKDFIIDTNIK